MSATSLIGDPVVNTQDEKVGDLKEIMLDVNSGRVAYGVLDFGGFLNMGNKLFAVPFDRFRVNEDDQKLVLNVEKETLKNAEGFDESNWPDTSNPDWERRIHSHYGATAYHERR
jgi:sporulation protein YlmC with PRC-barrel domain